MFWFSVLKELTHFIVKGCLQIVLLLRLMLGRELSQEVCQPAWTQSSQPQPSELPERKWKRQYHTAFDSAFITPLQIQVQNGQAGNVLSRCRTGSLYWQAKQIPQGQAEFSATGGYLFPAWQNPQKRQVTWEEQLIVLKDSFAAWTGARD